MSGKVISLIVLTIIIVITQQSDVFPSKGRTPYLVFLADDKNDALIPCPGVVISERHILTTYNCAREQRRNGIVLAGESPLSDNNSNYVSRPIFAVTVVPNYNAKKNGKLVSRDALAIVTLKSELPLGSTIVKAKLPEHSVKADESGLLSGTTGSCPDEIGLIGVSDIRSVKLTVTDSQECHQIRADEFCVAQEAILKEIGVGAPIVSDGVILGFGKFQCNDPVKRIFISVFSQLAFIKNFLDHGFELVDVQSTLSEPSDVDESGDERIVVSEDEENDGSYGKVDEIIDTSDKEMESIDVDNNKSDKSGESAESAIIEDIDSRYFVQFVNRKNLSKSHRPCVGVVISNRHVLTMSSCLPRKTKSLAIQKVGYGKMDVVGRVLTVAHSLQFHSKENSLAVVTLRKPLRLDKDIIRTQLPKENVNSGDKGIASGFAGVCQEKSTSDDLYHNTLTVTGFEKCSKLAVDEVCVEMGPESNLMGLGAPILSKGVIIGFTRFGCDDNGEHSIIDIFSHIRFINDIIKNRSEFKKLTSSTPNLELRYFAYFKRHNTYTQCLGVVISEKHVLTTSHCVSKKNKKIIVKMAGTLHLERKNVISRHIRGLQHVPDSHLVIVTLKRKVHLGENIIKVRLPKEKVEIGDIAHLSGFAGSCAERVTHDIQQTKLTAIDPKKCSINSDNFFCVYHETSLNPIESGAPVINNGMIVGFTQFGCNDKKPEGAVTSIFAHLKFIFDTLYGVRRNFQ